MEKVEHHQRRLQSRGLFLASIVLLLVMGRWGWVSLKHAAVRRLADELNQPGNFWGAPVANHANTAYIFGERSEIGIDLCLANAKTNRILLGSLAAGKFNVTTLRLLAWAPDDTACAYTHDGGLLLFDGISGQPLAALDTGGDMANFAWLSSSQCVTFKGLNLFALARQQNDWGLNHLLTLTNSQPVTALASLTDHFVVWRQGQEIWACDLNERMPKKIWEATTSPLVDFSVDSITGKLLLNLGAQGGSLFELNPFARQEWNSDRARVQKLDELPATTDYAFEISAFNEGKGRVYLTADTGERYTPAIAAFSAIKDKTLFVRKDGQSAPVQVLGRREVVDYSINQQHLYIMGSLTNEPCGIWEYDLDLAALTRVYSSWSPPSHASLVACQFQVITNAAGTSTTYRLWSPPHLIPGKKYPVMIGQTVYKWQAEPQIAANCGYYFALASRPIWSSPRLARWAEDVLAVRQELAKNPHVDANRVFLYGVSAEGSYVSSLMESKPELWQGAYLESATGPRLSAQTDHHPAIAIVVGKSDQELAVVAHYMDQMAQNGHTVQVRLRAGGHNWLSAATLRASSRSLAEFLSENN